MKLELLREQNFDPLCPICGGRSSDLHEIVSPHRKGSKYQPADETLAQWVYNRANCVLLCNKCNVDLANSRRDFLLRHLMDKYGPEEVIANLRGLARLSSPDRIPATMTYKEKDYGVR